MTFKEYKDCFKNNDGTYIEDIPPCINCTEEEYKICMSKHDGCKDFWDYIHKKYIKEV